MSKTEKSGEQNSGEVEEQPKKCGIVMPISSIDGCDENHWQEVLAIVKDSVASAKFEGELVSFSADVGVIHRRIVHNLYENPVVVCDVSGKNPNVMFELGLRLAFDKPTIIIKDDATNYSFDTSPIEHLEYPRSLRFSQIVDFKAQLSDKITATYEKSIEDEEYSPFLKHFGNFKVAKIDDTEVTAQEFLIDQLSDIKSFMLRQDVFNKKFMNNMSNTYKENKSKYHAISFDDASQAKKFAKIASTQNGIERADIEVSGGEVMVVLHFSPSLTISEINKLKDEMLSLL